MKIKLGKLFNSIKNFRCNPMINFTLFSKLFKSNKPYDALNHQKASVSNKFTTKQNITLFYYTFIYNESNDLLSIMETILHPFIDCLGRLLKIIGWVKIFILYIC
jgi:hypothetical protein